MKARLAILMLVAFAATIAVAATGMAGTHAAARRACTVNDERITYFPADGAAGRLYEKFRIRHKGSGSSCTVRGYPKVTLVGKKGRAMSIKVHREKGHKVRTRVVGKGHPAWFVLSHPTMDGKTGQTCRRKVYRFRILLRGQVKAFEIKGFTPIRFCDRGARVTPVTSKRPG